MYRLPEIRLVWNKNQTKNMQSFHSIFKAMLTAEMCRCTTARKVENMEMCSIAGFPMFYDQHKNNTF